MYNTGNPVPSAALEDMADNAQVFDALVTQTSGTVTDRLGNVRRSFQQIVTDMGFNPVSGSFQDGATITEHNQCLLDESTGTFYSWNGSLPKVVPAGSTPETAGGIGQLLWVDRTDLMLRSELSNSDGEKLIGNCATISALRNIIPSVANQKITVIGYSFPLDGGGGTFIYDSADATSTDDGGMVIVTTGGQRWKRQRGYFPGVDARWFGVISGTGDITAKLNLATQYSLINGIKLWLPDGVLQLDGTWLVNDDDFVCEGQGLSQTIIYTHKNGDGIPAVSVRKDGWDANVTYPGPRLRNFQLDNMAFWGSIENVAGTQSSRDVLDMGGVGFDFSIGHIWFYNIGRRAIVANDLWDGDIHNCKFHEVGTDTTFTSFQPHALAFSRKVDSCNAIRITNNHFEHCKRGAINIQDLCYSFFLTNNKFESTNSDVAYAVEYPIYIGDNHRNFNMIGGFCVLDQQDKTKHFIRCWGDNTYIETDMIGNTVNDGAAVLDLNVGNFGVGPTVRSQLDVKGDLSVYPIMVRSGLSDFSGSVVKIVNPGKCFDLGGYRNNIGRLRVVGVGTAGTNGYIFAEANPTNTVKDAVFSGVAPNASYISNVATIFEIGTTIMARNNSTTVNFTNGYIVDSTAIQPCNASGTTVDASAVLVGNWMCIGYASALVAGQESKSVSTFKRVS